MENDFTSKMKNSILIISLSDTSSDPRVLRQIDALRENFILDVAGFKPPNKKIRNFYDISSPHKIKNRWIRKFLKAFYLFSHQYEEIFVLENGKIELPGMISERYDLLIVNDFNSLPLAQQMLVPSTRVLLDAHEYYFGELNSKLSKQIHKGYRRWLSNTYFPIVDSMVTVSPKIAKFYEKKLGLSDVKVIRNIPSARPSEFESHSSKVIELVHHGSAVQGRGLAELIELIPLLREDFRLNLMLVETDKLFFESLVSAASRYPNRIRFLSVVPTESIVAEIKGFDLGIHLIPPTSVNNIFALPNKFFEFIHAHLGVITGPSPEMVAIIDKYSVGVASDSFNLESVASTINSLDRERVESMRISSFKASKHLNWEQESMILVRQILEVLKDGA